MSPSATLASQTSRYADSNTLMVTLYFLIFPKETMIGALANYISSPKDNFEPMNANFGILPDLEEKIKDKKIKYGKLADRSLEKIKYL